MLQNNFWLYFNGKTLKTLSGAQKIKSNENLFILFSINHRGIFVNLYKSSLFLKAITSLLRVLTHLSAKYCVATSPIGSLDRTTLAPLLWILSNLSYNIFHSASTIAWYSCEIYRVIELITAWQYICFTMVTTQYNGKCWSMMQHE